jgi:adenylyltransferase/sulfurtransferase
VSQPFDHITPRELADRLAAGDNIFLLDVRNPAEHNIAALPGSLLVPLPQLPYRVTEITPPAEAAVVVYCHHGVRSQNGAMFLAQAGFTNLYSLAGGIDAWSLEVDPSTPRY